MKLGDGRHSSTSFRRDDESQLNTGNYVNTFFLNSFGNKVISVFFALKNDTNLTTAIMVLVRLILKESNFSV